MRKILRDLSHLVVAYSSNEVRQCALTQCNKKINVNIFTCGWKTGEEASCNNSNNDKLKRSQKKFRVGQDSNPCLHVEPN